MDTTTSAPTSINDLRCTRCKADPGHGCITLSGNPCNEPHMSRVNAYWAAASAAAAKADA